MLDFRVYRSGIQLRKRLTDSRTQVCESVRAKETVADLPRAITSPAKAAAMLKIRHGSPGARTVAQVDRLLAALRRFKHSGGVTTIEARDHLGIPHPAGRVQKLREAGFSVEATTVLFVDDAGDPHRVARYCLVAEPSEIR